MEHKLEEGENSRMDWKKEIYARDMMGFRDTHDIIHMLILYADSGVVPPMSEHGRPYRLPVGVQDQPHSAGCRAR